MYGRFGLVTASVVLALCSGSFAMQESAVTESQASGYDVSGTWTVQFGDSTQSGSLELELRESASRHISGTYKSSVGGNGIVDGSRDGDVLQLNLAQTIKDCPGTFSGTVHLSDANSGSGQFTGRDCAGDHANGVVLITRGRMTAVPVRGNAGETDPAQAAGKSETQAALSADVVAEREKIAKSCPGCAGVMIAYVDAQTGGVTYDWATKHQIDWVHKQQE